MKTLKLKSPQELKAIDEAIIKAYHEIVRATIEVAKNCMLESFRTRIELDHVSVHPVQDRIHEVLSPLLFLSLERCEDRRLYIVYSPNPDIVDFLGDSTYTKLIRNIYKATMSDHTEVNIENCLKECPLDMVRYHAISKRILERMHSYAKMYTCDTPFNPQS
ncbi:hypothetical protein [Hufsiella ginkgonis]|uniref:Uncharacterized protein n=1 Tax=Hufsiella ginkgonis TaxID=2695274 RepID=A0A7K1Y347_9SPHI|nr:hypothetical protein [Hufsiella ginkgonis]MXV17724.1 hypothetical protein [Hufsiella ginkgonis]